MPPRGTTALLLAPKPLPPELPLRPSEPRTKRGPPDKFCLARTCRPTTARQHAAPSRLQSFACLFLRASPRGLGSAGEQINLSLPHSSNIFRGRELQRARPRREATCLSLRRWTMSAGTPAPKSRFALGRDRCVADPTLSLDPLRESTHGGAWERQAHRFPPSPLTLLRSPAPKSSAARGSDATVAAFYSSARQPSRARRRYGATSALLPTTSTDFFLARRPCKALLRRGAA